MNFRIFASAKGHPLEVKFHNPEVPLPVQVALAIPPFSSFFELLWNQLHSWWRYVPTIAALVTKFGLKRAFLPPRRVVSHIVVRSRFRSKFYGYEWNHILCSEYFFFLLCTELYHCSNFYFFGDFFLICRKPFFNLMHLKELHQVS